VMDVSGNRAKVELGEGVVAVCRLAEQKASSSSTGGEKADLSALTAMLATKWKSGGGSSSGPEPLRGGQVRSFKICGLDAEQKRVDVELA
jgi:small subunit ribosomal protein S1